MNDEDFEIFKKCKVNELISGCEPGFNFFNITLNDFKVADFLSVQNVLFLSAKYNTSFLNYNFVDCSKLLFEHYFMNFVSMITELKGKFEKNKTTLENKYSEVIFSNTFCKSKAIKISLKSKIILGVVLFLLVLASAVIPITVILNKKNKNSGQVAGTGVPGLYDGSHEKEKIVPSLPNEIKDNKKISSKKIPTVLKSIISVVVGGGLSGIPAFLIDKKLSDKNKALKSNTSLNRKDAKASRN